MMSAAPCIVVLALIYTLFSFHAQALTPSTQYINSATTTPLSVAGATNGDSVILQLASCSSPNLAAKQTLTGNLELYVPHTLADGDYTICHAPRGSSTYTAVPYTINVDENAGSVVTLSSGADHVCALLLWGFIKCWGKGLNGRLGIGSTDQVSGQALGQINYASVIPPAYVVPPVSLGDLAINVAAGFEHTCGLRQDHKVVCWGKGADGRLGYGNTNDVGDDEKPSAVGPVQIGSNVIQIAAGGAHTCVLQSDFKIRCWGQGQFGQLGVGSTSSLGDSALPSSGSTVDIGGDAVQVVTGQYHTCALRIDGAVFCWGLGEHGQLGYGSTSNVGHSVPTLPLTIGPVSIGLVSKLSAGANHTCAMLTTVGAPLVCWGKGDNYRLCNGDTVDKGTSPSTIPSLLPLIPTGGKNGENIFAGHAHTCAILTDGSTAGPRCCGSNSHGAAGTGGLTDVPLLSTDVPLDPSDPFAILGAGSEFTCAVGNNNGYVACWGEGAFGKLGTDNGVADCTAPTPALSLFGCGDGVTSSADAETCDDGNSLSGDGCDSACIVEAAPGRTCSASAWETTTCSTCSDNVKGGTEACDDGNGVNGDGCSSSCTIESNYVCTVQADGSSLCSPDCGDGLLLSPEQCDDGNENNLDGCSSACVQETGYTCTPASPSVCSSTCGDSVRATGSEQCDDGNAVNGDGCSSTCSIESGYTCTSATPNVCTAECGNGVRIAGEGCDDGNVVNGDGCSSTCSIESGYTCTSATPNVCTAECGNGVRIAGEGCDDGNTVNGDGCSSTCSIESGYTCTSATPNVCTAECGNGVRIAGEGCDDGNAVSGDGCSSTCSIESGYACAVRTPPLADLCSAVSSPAENSTKEDPPPVMGAVGPAASVTVTSSGVVAIGGAVAVQAVASTTGAAGSLGMVWSLLSSFQLINMLGLLNVPYPSDLAAFFAALDWSNLKFFSSPIEDPTTIIGDEDETQLPGKLADKEMSVLFVTNAFSLLLMFVGLVVGHGATVVASKRWPRYKILYHAKHAFHFAFYWRFLLSIYLELGVACCLQFFQLEGGWLVTISSIGAVTSSALVLFGFPAFIAYIIHKHSDHLSSNDVRGKYGSLYTTYRPHAFSNYFSIPWLLRKMLFILVITYLQDSPFVQLSCCVAISVTYIAIVAVNQPFLHGYMNRMELLVECALLYAHLLSFPFLLESSSDTLRAFCGWSILAVCVGSVLCWYVLMARNAIPMVRQLWRELMTRSHTRYRLKEVARIAMLAQGMKKKGLGAPSKVMDGWSPAAGDGADFKPSSAAQQRKDRVMLKLSNAFRQKNAIKIITVEDRKSLAYADTRASDEMSPITEIMTPTSPFSPFSLHGLSTARTTASYISKASFDSYVPSRPGSASTPSGAPASVLSPMAKAQPQAPAGAPATPLWEVLSMSSSESLLDDTLETNQERRPFLKSQTRQRSSRSMRNLKLDPPPSLPGQLDPSDQMD